MNNLTHYYETGPIGLEGWYTTHALKEDRQVVFISEPVVHLQYKHR